MKYAISLSVAVAMMAIPGLAVAQKSREYHESTKSPEELSDCLVKRLGQSGRLRQADADHMQIVEHDKSGRETGRWEIIRTPEGSAATFRARAESGQSAVNGDVCG